MGQYFSGITAFQGATIMGDERGAMLSIQLVSSNKVLFA